MKNIKRILTTQIDSIEQQIEDLQRKQEELKVELSFIDGIGVEFQNFQNENKRIQLPKVQEELKNHEAPISSPENIIQSIFPGVGVLNNIDIPIPLQVEKELEPELEKVPEPIKIVDKNKLSYYGGKLLSFPLSDRSQREEKLNENLNNINKNQRLAGIVDKDGIVSAKDFDFIKQEQDSLNNIKSLIKEVVYSMPFINKTPTYSIDSLKNGDFVSVIKRVDSSIKKNSYSIDSSSKKIGNNFINHHVLFKNYGDDFKNIANKKDSNEKMLPYFEINISVVENTITNSFDINNAFLLSQENFAKTSFLPNKISNIDLKSFLGLSNTIELFKKLSDLYKKDKPKSLFETTDTFIHNGF